MHELRLRPTCASGVALSSCALPRSALSSGEGELGLLLGAVAASEPEHSLH